MRGADPAFIAGSAFAACRPRCRSTGAHHMAERIAVVAIAVATQ
jgi:hypothetical protein